jgi:hypothetical protein
MSSRYFEFNYHQMPTVAASANTRLARSARRHLFPKNHRRPWNQNAKDFDFPLTFSLHLNLYPERATLNNCQAMKSFRLAALAAALCCSQILFSQQQILDIQRLTEPVTFDGKVNEAAWTGATPLPFSQQQPNFGQPPTEHSEAFLAYDDEYLYMAGRMHLSDSALYRATTFKRDALDGTTDYFGMVLDSYNDNENALSFFTTPTGLRWDGTIANDALDDDAMSIDWNTFWDAAVSRTPDGWHAEIRIPWTSLRFQDREGDVLMGIVTWWYIGAKNEVDMFPLIPLNWGSMSGWKPSQMQDIRFRGVYSRKPLYLTPYLLGGYQQTHNLNDSETAYLTDHDPKFEAGLDLKYSLTSNLTLDLTANTDFAQVEVDDQQVNLTRFNLFFPEKRQFFQERASLFDFQFEGFNRLFYSRRIGINDDDEAVRIYGGARLQGRIGAHDLGFLSMQTAAPADSLHSENFSVLRMRRQAFNQYSYLGFIGLNRTDFHGSHHTAYGFDGIVRVVKDEYLTAKWVQSFENGKTNKPLSLDPARIFLFWERRRYDGFSYAAAFSRVGKDYSPAMGFEERENFSSLAASAGYGHLMGEQSKILRWLTYVEGLALENNGSGRLESAYLEVGAEMESKTGWFAFTGIRPSHEYVAEAFDIGDTEVPVGEYDFVQMLAVFGTPIGNRYGLMCEATLGGYYDGNIASVSLTPRLNVSSHLNLEGFLQINRGRFPDRQTDFSTYIGKLKAEYLWNTKISLSAFLQYNSDEQVFLENIRFRYNPKEGNDFFIVFNDLLNSNRKRDTPHRPFSDTRSVVVKYTYTFQL